MTFRYAYPIEPPGARTGHDPNEVLGRKDKPYAPAHVFLQTTDAEGFVFPYGRARWPSEKECCMQVLQNKPMAIESTCRVEGFGQVMCRADDSGRLYDPSAWRDGKIMLFDVEAAQSEIAFCQRRLKAYQQQGFAFEPEVSNELDRASETLKRALRQISESDILAQANRALGLALHLSEKIELARARQKLAKLGAKRAFSFGSFLYVKGDTWHQDPTFAERYRGIFNHAVVSVFQHHVQKMGPATWDWSAYDKRFGFIREHGLEGIGHCLGWPASLPEWLRADPEHLIEHLEQFAEVTVERYGALVRLWAILNEAHDWTSWPDDLAMTLEERVATFKALRACLSGMQPGVAVEADTCVTNAAGRMVKAEWKIGPREWYKALYDAGVNDFVIGLQIYHGGGEYATFDLGRLTRHLEIYAQLGCPMHLYVETPGGYSDQTRMKVNGAWHGAWTEQTQADWWEQFMTIVLSIPLVRGITIIALSDADSFWVPKAAFCRDDLSPKPVYERLTKVLDRYTAPELRVEWH